MSSTRLVSLAAIVAVFGCGIGLAVGLAGSPAGAHPRPLRVSHSRISPALRRHFRVFRDRRNHAFAHAADTGALPSGVQAQLSNFASPDDPSAQQFQLDTAGTQQVAGESGDTVWVVPGGRGACVITSTPPMVLLHNRPATDSDCASTSQALAAGIIAVGLGSDGSSEHTHIVYGLVPDGNKSVVAEGPSGQTATIPVVDDTVADTLDFAPTSITVLSANGTVVHTI
jgi:hypothetical protein